MTGLPLVLTIAGGIVLAWFVLVGTLVLVALAFGWWARRHDAPVQRHLHLVVSRDRNVVSHDEVL